MAARHTKVKAIPHAHYVTHIVFSVIVPHLPYVKKGFFEKIGIITVRHKVDLFVWMAM